MTKEERQQRREARAARKEARAKRIAERNARTIAQNAPPPIVLPENTDPLVIKDRFNNPIGHPLRNLWSPNPGFLVGGGPSINEIDYMRLAERGVVSLGVNNIAAKVPVSAMTFSDGNEKFHHGIYFDPCIMKFVPAPKLGKRIRAKIAPYCFHYTAYKAKDCPNVWAYDRDAIFVPETFLTHTKATWGHGKEGMLAYEKLLLPPRDRVLFTFLLGLRLMHYLGCRRTYLLGVDFTMTKEKGYAFNQERWEGSVRGNQNHYRLVTKMLKELKPIFDDAGFVVLNCNPDSHLEVFPFVPYEQALKDAKGGVPEEPFDCAGWYQKTPDGRLPEKDKSKTELMEDDSK